jgi:serine acetyltransferase
MLPNIINRLLHKLAFVAPGGYSLRPWLHRLRGCNIGKGVWVSQLVYIDEVHPEAVTIGENSSIGLRTSIFTHFYWGPRRTNESAKPVVIEKNVFVGPHCVILPNVRIGEGSVIKAGTVVSRNIPRNTIWGPPFHGALGIATTPLTHEHEYEEFVKGIRPLSKRKE